MLKYLLSKIILKIQVASILNSHINKKSKVCAKSHLVNCEIGRYTYIGYDCKIYNASIGSFCSIAGNCFIGGAMHPLEFVSTSPVFHEGKNILNKNFSKHQINEARKVTIGNDVWIGEGVYIKQGIKIGDGAVIGMGAVVTHDVPDYTIVAGSPARILRKRFKDEEIEKLLEIKWWMWDETKIEKFAKYFNDPKRFISELSKGENK